MSSCSQTTYQISIHAPRGGSDIRLPGLGDPASDFNPRSPWGERRRQCNASQRANQFQSTLPVGGATSFNRRRSAAGRGFQSTLPVGGATGAFLRRRQKGSISIHAPRGGSDSKRRHPTLKEFFISIHAPRGGSDVDNCDLLDCLQISIHAPRGGSDPQKYAELKYARKFQSTLPVGGATSACSNCPNSK